MVADRQKARDLAEELLYHCLRDGPVYLEALEECAAVEGICAEALHRAADDLMCKSDSILREDGLHHKILGLSDHDLMEMRPRRNLSECYQRWVAERTVEE